VHVHDADRHMLLDPQGSGGLLAEHLAGVLGLDDGEQVSEQLMRSMAERILPLEDDLPVLPGHGPPTTIGRERATNPFLLQLQTGAGPR
jgi:hydroxyacylglutathione hydrolase